MYTKADLLAQIAQLGVGGQDRVLVHSSMKAIGSVENGADDVLDALSESLKDGLLIFPTHTWKQMNEEYTLFDPQTEPSCVGVLTEIFRKRPGVVRSLHPTHSVAALGARAQEFTQGEEHSGTCCARTGCWGKLYDWRAKIMFLGCSLSRNTFLHGVEEWHGIPERLTEQPQPLRVRMPDGTIIDRPMRRHHSPYGDVSQNYVKMEAPFFHLDIAREGRLGDARCVVCDAVAMADLVSEYLGKNPQLFADAQPVPTDWYM